MFSKPGKDRIFDDIARAAGGAAGIAGGLGANIKREIQSRIDELAGRLDLVPREDFDRAMEMLSEARLAQEDLKKRVEALEKNVKKNVEKNTGKTKPKTAKSKAAKTKKS